MKSDIGLLSFAASMAAMYASVACYGWVTQASGLAQELGPLIDVDVNTLRSHLNELFKKNSFRKAVMVSIPWLIVCAVLLMRIIRRWRAQSSQE